MITAKRKVTLNWTMNPTAFEDINKDSLVSLTRPLGTSVSAVNKMLACAEEMEMLLPNILGTSPRSNSANWAEEVSNYWHNFGLDIAPTGKVFNTSFVFDITDPFREKYITELVDKLKLNKKKAADKSETEGAENVTVTSSEAIEKAFAKYVMTEVPENLRFRYGTPENVEEYLAWRFCLLSSSVGNSPEEIVKEDTKGGKGELKSTRILFYLTDDAAIAKRKNDLQKLRNQAIGYYSKLVAGEESDVDTIVIATNLVNSIADLKELDKSDKLQLVYDLVINNPTKFNAIYEDKNVKTIAEIRKYTMAGLIRNVSNTSIYTDAQNPSQILGNTLAEVITYMSNDINKAYVNELVLKLNHIMK